MVKNTYLIKDSSRNQLRRCNIPPNHRLACSLISQQRCHPQARHDSPRNKEQEGLHIAKDTQNTTKPTQLVLSGNNGSTKPTQLGLSGHRGARKG